jgi:hypothetical protein
VYCGAATTLAEEVIMAISAITTALTSATSALTHGHAHKRGIHGDSQDPTAANPTGQAPAGTTQNLFSSLLDTAEQLLGVKPAAAVSAAQAALQPVQKS